MPNGAERLDRAAGEAKAAAANGGQPHKSCLTPSLIRSTQKIALLFEVPYDVMVVKVRDEFVWHKHDNTDDFFLVLKGIEHRPVAREDVHLLLIEPTGTPNAGNATTAAPRKTA